ncbi:MAG TPA: sulfatase-like hydrolase/transferase [Verrucomicrobiales bacterium]|nr:sulfatase-like hydrolase/transferase [Verrucomicrobiales bacterium]
MLARCCFWVWIVLAWTSSAWGRPPNVVVILSDDQGSVDTRLYGSEDLETPNLDRLAREGIRFTRFYAAAPLCSPSRAGLLTGRYPVRAGVPGNTSSEKGKPGMPAEEITLAEMFRDAGYATGHIGKWHLGSIPEHTPNGQGFDYSFGHMGGCIDNFSHFFYWQGPNRHDLWRNGAETHAPGRYFPDLMVEEATAFLRKHRDRPFFLFFALNSPHYPYQGEAEWLERYRELSYPRNLYAAFLSSMDARIGQLLDAIDSLGLREETIVVFQSDHGHSTEERAHFGGGNAGPYRGAKFSLFEGGIRVPALACYPGRIPEGEQRASAAHSCDWLPTLAELAGVAPPGCELDGRSLREVIVEGDSAATERRLHWMAGLDPEAAQWAMMEGDWKLIGNPRDTSLGREEVKLPELFLSHLGRDVGERRNFALEHPEVVERLRAAHRDLAGKLLK